jgi:hypothetical protein
MILVLVLVVDEDAMMGDTPAPSIENDPTTLLEATIRRLLLHDDDGTIMEASTFVHMQVATNKDAPKAHFIVIAVVVEQRLHKK